MSNSVDFLHLAEDEALSCLALQKSFLLQNGEVDGRHLPVEYSRDSTPKGGCCPLPVPNTTGAAVVIPPKGDDMGYGHSQQSTTGD